MLISTHRDPRTPQVATIRIETIALLFLAAGCSGPALEPWHTEQLTYEFTADSADEVRTFDDYRQLEDRLNQVGL